MKTEQEIQKTQIVKAEKPPL